MDALEVRMRCLEAAQAATRTAVPTSAEHIVGMASKFESYVLGPEPKAAPAARAKKETAQ